LPRGKNNIKKKIVLTDKNAIKSALILNFFGLFIVYTIFKNILD
jgi:hypothetical protein